MKTSRRSFITKSVLSAAALGGGVNVLADSAFGRSNLPAGMPVPATKDPDAFKISIFSKHLQWLDYKGMAEAVAEIGLDGVDLTVRPQGHVLPEKVEQDLPKAVEAVNKAGKKVYMLATAIDNPDDPVTEKILRTAGSLGIKHYRMGWGHYNDSKSVEENIASMKGKLEKLAKLNEKYKISGEYQNHSGVARDGVYFGGAIWDIAGILKEINSPWLGSQYDVYHASVEGANTWPIGFRLISGYVKSIDIKDFTFFRKDGKWTNETVPLGEGQVDFKKYFGLLKQYDIRVPVSLHFEYPLGGAENGAGTITMKREDVLTAMSKDVVKLKSYLKEAGLI
jgi:L-ribulose-5-phosphate 3-epimerase